MLRLRGSPGNPKRGNFLFICSTLRHVATEHFRGNMRSPALSWSPASVQHDLIAAGAGVAHGASSA